MCGDLATATSYLATIGRTPTVFFAARGSRNGSTNYYFRAAHVALVAIFFQPKHKIQTPSV
ncbi:hypothetical protein J6590_090258 [Homalodisca vitripennis]|nr:hypothetical protein J6590_090258 [Homalodisca vitripennis]